MGLGGHRLVEVSGGKVKLRNKPKLGEVRRDVWALFCWVPLIAGRWCELLESAFFAIIAIFGALCMGGHLCP